MPPNLPADYFNALPEDRRRRVAPATSRNREPILEVLASRLPQPGRVLEVASGTGEHAAFFCASLARLEWQPTDVDPDNLTSITAWKEALGLPNMLLPRHLDVLAAGSPVFEAESYDAGFCANLIHIAPWQACENLLQLMGHVLKADAPLVLYGPYKINGEHTSPSNEQFEQWLHGLDPRFGVRDIAEVEAFASTSGLRFVETLPMPANNFCLVFRRKPQPPCRIGTEITGHLAPQRQ